MNDAWAAKERQARLDDLASVRGGTMTLKEAQARARGRRNAIGLRKSEAATLIHIENVKRRRAAIDAAIKENP